MLRIRSPPVSGCVSIEAGTIYVHTISMHTKGKASPVSAVNALQRLKAEIALNRDFREAAEAAFLAMLWTWQCLEDLCRIFFPRYVITDVHLDCLMSHWDIQV